MPQWETTLLTGIQCSVQFLLYSYSLYLFPKLLKSAPFLSPPSTRLCHIFICNKLDSFVTLYIPSCGSPISKLIFICIKFTLWAIRVCRFGQKHNVPYLPIQYTEQFHHPKKSFVLHMFNTHTTSGNHWPLFVCIVLPVTECCINETIPCVAFQPSSFHSSLWVSDSSSLLWWLLHCLFCWFRFHCLDGPQFVYPLTDARASWLLPVFNDYE